jgi:hypothetical protein
MRKKLPPLDHKGKTKYIELHLFNELRWLLGAATEWSIQDRLKLRIVGYDMQVYALDSSVLHARTLFEFFVVKTTGNHYGCDQFLATGSVLNSDSYSNDWEGPVHSFLMHAQDRSQPQRLKTPDGPKDLNEMPVYFAREILRLWEEFERKLGKSNDPRDQKLQELACEKRKEAIEKAQCVVNSLLARRHAYARESGEPLKPVFVFVG